MRHTPTHPHAVAAIRAAQLRPRIGHWAAWRYCARRGVPHSLFVVAMVLEAATRAGV